ncbi:MAG TPA: hypothetical protein VMD57_06175, partial [Candidatus Baltobacteraceae bacterium]|nr:hypothetical protein [Candidatus Baltobacteraceae bacterium]
MICGNIAKISSASKMPKRNGVNKLKARDVSLTASVYSGSETGGKYSPINSRFHHAPVARRSA